jgi:hypothetical protein
LFGKSHPDAGAFIEETVKEVFEYLRSRNSRYKTNTEFEIGKRAILFALETTGVTGR